MYVCVCEGGGGGGITDSVDESSKNEEGNSTWISLVSTRPKVSSTMHTITIPGIRHQSTIKTGLCL